MSFDLKSIKLLRYLPGSKYYMDIFNDKKVDLLFKIVDTKKNLLA